MRRFRPLRRDPGGTAQLQDPRHLHPALAPRRQARLSPPHSARLATHRGGSARAGLGPDRHLARPASAAPGPAYPRSAERRVSRSSPKTAMILAAGRGTRMRPISDTIPKPLLEVEGRTLLDHAIERLALAGVERGVVNAHYKADTIATHLAGRRQPQVEISQEEEALENGGGVLRALPSLGETFFVVNADVLWLDSKDYALTRLAGAFDPDCMDAVLLMQRTVTAVGYDGRGDYFLDRLGNPRRRRECEIAPYLFTGIQLLHRRAFDGLAARRFSLNLVYDKADQAGRLHAIVHDGEWFHVGTPEGLTATRARLASHRTER